MSEDEEDRECYVEGGYHPEAWMGSNLHRLARKGYQKHLKILKSAQRYTDEALIEIELLHLLNPASTPSLSWSALRPPPSPATTHPGRSHVVSFLDYFLHVGPNGLHFCMVFEALGESLVSLIMRHGDKGVPMDLVKQISKQILLGLDYIHRCCGIIHTDLKPENVLIAIDDVESSIDFDRETTSSGSSEMVAGEQQDRITVKIVNFRNSTWAAHHFTDDIQTRQYRCPEAILGAKWGTSADLWSVACTLFELMTCESLFEPAAGARYSKDDDHLAQIIELLGEMPKNIVLSGKYSRKFFNRKGELRRIRKLSYWSLESVLHEKYDFPTPEADAIAAFLTPMLRFDPEKRARARELIDHSWLEGIVVQGEIDVIRRAKEGDEIKDWTTQKRQNKRDMEGSKRKKKVPLSDPDYEAMLSHFENIKPGRRSPTSSSSGYGSTSSVRSRSSMSTDPNDFPYSIANTYQRHRTRSISLMPSSPPSAPVSNHKGTVAAALSSEPSGGVPEKCPEAPALPFQRYRLPSFFKGKKKPSS